MTDINFEVANKVKNLGQFITELTRDDDDDTYRQCHKM